MSWNTYIGAVLRGYDEHFYRITAHDQAGLHLEKFGPGGATKCISERAFGRTFMMVSEWKPGRLRCERWGNVRETPPQEVLAAVRAWEQREEDRASAKLAGSKA